MWFKKKETDIEMEEMRGQRRKDTTPDDTDYRPINWKKIFFSPKYIRMLFCRARPGGVLTNRQHGTFSAS